MSTRSGISELMFRITNILAASFFVLCVMVPDSWCYGPYNPSLPPGAPGPVTAREIILTVVTFVWFISALGLFFRSKLAWFGCGLGIGMATYISGCLLFDVATLALFPHAAGAETTVAWRAMVVRILAPVMMIGTASVPAVVCVGLIIGLVKSHRDLRWILL